MDRQTTHLNCEWAINTDIIIQVYYRGRKKRDFAEKTESPESDVAARLLLFPVYREAPSSYLCTFAGALSEADLTIC